VRTQFSTDDVEDVQVKWLTASIASVELSLASRRWTASAFFGGFESTTETEIDTHLKICNEDWNFKNLIKPRALNE